MTLELPALLLADRLATGLALACGPALEIMLARQSDALTGAGLILGLALLLWQLRRARSRPCRLQVSPAGPQIAFGTADHPVPAAAGRARVLGTTVVLHWYGRRGPGPSQGILWITPWDLPEDSLRLLRVALVAGSAVGR